MLAERAAVPAGYAIEIPETVDDLVAAAIVNPATSSWVPLSRLLPAGGTVLIVGATGVSGLLAVQTARVLGAARVVAVGRNPAGLERARELGADATVELSGDLGPALQEAANGYDVVLDYLWGEPASTVMTALLTARTDRSRPLDWVQIGAVAGPTIELPSVALRSANLRLQGNGQGAVSTRVYLEELPSLAEEINGGRLHLEVRTCPLADVEQAWTAPAAPGVRTVLTMC
jgi:NADPH:quinone reductase-like Zn-dependent oxidoreductase